jgi:nicotinamide riboside kinase
MAKIGVVGSFSTGKSTLAERLAKDLGAGFVEEVVRNYPEKPDWARYTPEDYFRFDAWIMSMWGVREVEEELKRRPDLVIDAGMLASLAYLETRQPPGRLAFWNEYTDRWLAWRPYDIIFKTPCIGMPPKDDGFRHLDPAFRKAIDAGIERALAERNLAVVRLPDTYDPTLETQYRAMRDALGR